MFKKANDYLGITLTADSIKLVHLQKTGKDMKLAGAHKQSVRDMPEEDLIRVISEAARELNVRKPVVFCTVPVNIITTKNIEIPSLDDAEIKSIIDLQAGRHTPYSREEILVGYIKIGVFQRNYTKILLAIVNRDVINKQLFLLDEAGLKIEKLFFGPEATALWYARALKVGSEDIPVGIIDIAHQVTNFIIEYNNTVATCRSIPVGLGRLIKEGTSAQEELIQELVKSVEAYQSEDINQLPEVYVLTGDDAKIKNLAPIIQSHLKANVKVMPFLDQIPANQPAVLKLVSEYNDDSFLDVVSVTRYYDQLTVDLTPDEIKTKRTIEEKGRQLVRLAIFSIILLLFVCATFFSKLYFKTELNNRYEEEYLRQRAQVITLDRIAQKTRIIKDYLATRMQSLEVIEEIYRLIPNEMYVENIYLDEKGSIDIQGVSDTMSLVFNFVTALEESELFKDVKTKSTTDKKDRGKDVAAFYLQLRLESASDEIEEEASDEEVDEAALEQ